MCLHLKEYKKCNFSDCANIPCLKQLLNAENYEENNNRNP